MSLKTEVEDQIKKFTADLTILVSFLGICIAVVSNINHVLSSKEFIYAVIAGACIIIMRICYKIWKSDSNAQNSTPAKYSMLQQKIAAWLMFIVGALAPLSIASMEYFDDRNFKMSIIVTPFSKEPEPFSENLFNLIEVNKKIHKFDTILTVFHDSCLVRNTVNTENIIANVFSKAQSDRGILVFGYRNNDQTKEKYFNCYIYINNLQRLKVDSAVINTEQSNEKVIYMLNPLFIEFASSTQAEIISDFIMGLLFINSEKFELAEQTFNKIKTGSDDQLKKVSRQLRANCDYWLGETFLKEKKTEKAFNAFNDANKSDTANAYILQKLATLLLTHKTDTLEAYRLFLKAKTIDSTIQVPIEQPSNYLDIMGQNIVTNLNTLNSATITSVPRAAQTETSFKPKSNEQSSNHNSTTSISSVANLNTKKTNSSSIQNTNTNNTANQNSIAKPKPQTTSTLNSTPSTSNPGFLQLPIHESTFSESDIIYNLVLYGSKSNLYYITKDNEVILFTDASGKFYKSIGKLVRSGANTYTIQDLNKTPMYSVLNKKILSSNVEVGELRAVRN